jgi:hypothetical protein
MYDPVIRQGRFFWKWHILAMPDVSNPLQPMFFVCSAVIWENIADTDGASPHRSDTRLSVNKVIIIQIILL